LQRVKPRKPKSEGASTRPPRTKPVAANPEKGKLGEVAIVAGSNARPGASQRIRGDYSEGVKESTARRWAEEDEAWIKGGEISFSDHMVGKGRRKEGPGNRAVWYED